MAEYIGSPLETTRIILEVFSEFEALNTNLKLIRAMYSFLKDCVTNFGILMRTKNLITVDHYEEIIGNINVGRFKIGRALELLKLWERNFIESNERDTQSVFMLKQSIKDLEIKAIKKPDDGNKSLELDPSKHLRKIMTLKDSIKNIYISNKINYGLKPKAKINYTDNPIDEKTMEKLNTILLNKKEIEKKEKYYFNKEKVRLENLLTPYKNNWQRKNLIEALRTSISIDNKPLKKEISDYLRDQKIKIF